MERGKGKGYFLSDVEIGCNINARLSNRSVNPITELRPRKCLFLQLQELSCLKKLRISLFLCLYSKLQPHSMKQGQQALYLGVAAL